jgi:archaeosine-15-forming tRNA-guanine transglycosylase
VSGSVAAGPAARQAGVSPGSVYFSFWDNVFSPALKKAQVLKYQGVKSRHRVFICHYFVDFLQKQ